MTIPVRQRLSYRQAKTAVWAGLLLGLIVSGFQVASDLFQERERIRTDVAQLVEVVRESAGEAAYNLNPRHAEKVIAGLFNHRSIHKVMVRDDFDQILAQRERPPGEGRLEWLVRMIDRGDRTLTVPLSSHGRNVGGLTVTIDPYAALEDFLGRAGLIILGGVVRNLLLAVILFSLFYQAITRPLLRLADQVGEVDPQAPAVAPLVAPKEHRDDEMGSLIGSMNALLNAFGEALETRRSAEAEVREVLEQMPVMLDAFDDKGEVLVWNKECERVTGFTAEEMVGDPRAMERLYPDPAYREQMFAAWAEREDNYRDWEWEIACKDGVVKTISWSNISSLFPIQGWVTWGVGVDITERKRAEEALQLARFSIENTQEAFFWINERGYFFEVNQAACDYLGYTREELLTLSVFDIDPLVPRESWPGMMRAFEEEGARQFESVHKRKDGSRMAVDIGINFLLYQGKKTLFSHVADITQRRHMEEQLRQAQKMEAVGVLAGGVAHDFNNILGVILGSAELALLEKKGKKEIPASRLEAIQKAGFRARDLVAQLLTFSRKSDLEKQETPLAPLVREALKFMRSTLPAAIRIEVEIQDEEASVFADATQIHQILMNLCTNAAFAMKEEGGLLTVSQGKARLGPEEAGGLGLESGEFFTLTVRDTGAGIPPEVRERIFEPFFTTKEVGKGTGMGLAVAHGIIRSHNGTISVESKVGEGAAFKVYLPCYGRAREVGNAQDAKEDQVGGMGRVLLVDDEPQLLDVGARMLTVLGYQVEVAEDPEKALTLFMADPDAFDILITDQSMPGMTGAVLGEAILAIRPDLPILISTGFSDFMSPQRARKLGFAGFLQKPLVIKELDRELRNILGR